GLWLLFCLFMLALDLILAASPRNLSIERELPRRLRLGESGASEVLLRNLGRKNMRLSVRDAWQPSAHSAPSRVTLALPAGERRRLVWTLTPIRRGMIRSEFMTVRSFGPLRLTARQVTLKSV